MEDRVLRTVDSFEGRDHLGCLDGVNMGFSLSHIPSVWGESSTVGLGWEFGKTFISRVMTFAGDLRNESTGLGATICYTALTVTVP